MMNTKRYQWGLALALFAAACGGEEAGCLAPTDFPVDQRIPNAVQFRIAQPGFERIGSNVAELVTAAFGSTRLGFEPQCEGNVQVCCGLPADTCGITLDLDERPGDGPRLAFTELGDGRSGLNVSFKTRVFTDRTLDVRIIGPLGGVHDCDVDINTAWAGVPELSVGASLTLEEDPMTQTTRVGLGDFTVTGLDEGDFSIIGGGLCGNARDRLEDIEAEMQTMLAEEAPKILDVPLCKSCQVDSDCGGVGTCNEDFVCEVPGQGEEGPRCIQQLGTSGRLPAGELFGSLAAGAAMDLYLVSNSASAPNGGLSFSGNSGIFIPTIGGVAPGGPGCAPSVPAPEVPAEGIDLSEMMSANSMDGLGDFDFGVAIHKTFLDRAGWAFHQSGMFCTTIDTSTIEALNADSLGVMFPSLADLVDGANTPISVRLRPQKPPTFRMNDPAGALVVVFEDLDVDFFMYFRERNVRLFTARSDAAIPLDLNTDMDGAMVPALGDMANAFTNIRVSNPGLLGEPTDDIGVKFEAIGGLSMNLLIGSIGEFQLPALPLMNPKIMEKGLRGLDGGDFLGIFGELEIAQPGQMPLAADQRWVKTEADVVSINLPDAEAYGGPRLDKDDQPSIDMSLGGRGISDEKLEWQYRINGGAWSKFHRDPELRISRIELWVPAVHSLEVRARHWDRPESTDPTPTKFMVDLRPRTGVLAGATEREAEMSPFADSKSENGCASSSSGKGALWLVLAMLFSLVFARRRRGNTALLCLALVGTATQTACLLGTDAQGEKGPAYGRWSDVASDGRRAIATSYEARKGNLVLGTVVATGVKAFEIVDEDGDVGAWSSLELVNGYARIAYQDRGNGRLKFATESLEGFATHVIDQSDGVTIGRYASLAKRPGGGLGIAYLAENPQAEGGMITQLRIAETDSDTPTSHEDWTRTPLQFARVETVESAPVDAVPLGTGLYSQLAYLSTGDPVITYCDTTAPALVVARRVGGGEWTSRVLDDNAETGPCAFASMAIGSDDSIHIAYQTTIANDVRYIYLAPGSEIGEVLVVDDGSRDDSQRPVGGSTTIILDSSGAPLIVYQDGFSMELRIARLSQGAWAHEVAASGAAALGFSIGMAWYKDQLIISSGAVNRDKLQAHQVTTTVIK